MMQTELAKAKGLGGELVTLQGDSGSAPGSDGAPAPMTGEQRE